MKKIFKINAIISLAISILFLSNIFTFAAPNKSGATNKINSTKVTAKNKPESAPTLSKKSSSIPEKKDNNAQTKKSSTSTIETSSKSTNNNSVSKKNISAPTEKAAKNDKKSNQVNNKTNTQQPKNVENKKSVTENKQNTSQKEPATEIKKTSNNDKNNLEIAIDDKDTADGFQSIQNNTQDQEDDCLYIKILGIMFISLGSIGFLLSLYWLITKRKNIKNNNKKSDKPQKQKKERYKGTHFK